MSNKADEYDLDMRVTEAAQPIAALLRNTDDNCGNTCQNGATACVSYDGDAA
ncbi:FxLD family lanthipeptide [Streptomyces sp. NPDC127110]|uniref:FxLD family lanthipeptide n=1 Tax=Streptomyces sp. NPDC127110 TaxID=3345362 RepID=UPI0036260BF3